MARVDKIVQSTVGEGNAAVGQGFWDQEAPGNGLFVGCPKALLEVEAGNGSHVHGYLCGCYWSSDECAQCRNFGLTATYAAVLVLVSENLGSDAIAGN
jgi:hypothetical protein